MLMKIKLEAGAHAPTRAHQTDAGLDLYAKETKIIKAENNVIRIGDLCDYVIDFNVMTEKEGGKG